MPPLAANARAGALLVAAALLLAAAEARSRGDSKESGAPGYGEELRAPEPAQQLAASPQPAANASNASAREAKWIKKGHSIKIYVYDLPANITLRVSEEDRNHNYYFEVVLPKLLRMSSAHRVFDPRKADFFFVPVEAAAYWYLCKTKNSCSTEKADQMVTSYLRSVGPWWDMYQERHIVPSLRCPVPAKSGPSMKPTFPELWEGRAQLLCLQAARDTLDERRALHVGYYVPDMNVSDLLPANTSERDLLAVYIGAAINRYRMTASSWMERACSDCRTFVLKEHSSASNDVLRGYHAALKRARFSIEPPGDTLERMSRDAGLMAGSIPVVFEYPEGYGFHRQYLPWAPVLDWSNFSVNFTMETLEVADIQNFMPRLDKLLRDMVSSGEADRLYAGLAHAQKRLRWSEEGVVTTFAGMLAHRKHHLKHSSP